MHDGSQIQDDMREDDSDQGNFREEFRCHFCKKDYSTRQKRLDTHERKCVKLNTCMSCGWLDPNPSYTSQSKELKNHKKSCEQYKVWRSNINKGNGQWSKRKTKEEMNKWRQNVSAAVSKGVMASESARESRRQNMIKRNKSLKARVKSSETAKITSARPDIIKQRTEQLRKWRKENPEEFEKVILENSNRWKSIPEIELFEILFKDFPSLKRGQIFYNKDFQTKTSKRQCDILDKNNKISIEFDGPWHFQDIGISKVKLIQEKDNRFNKVMSSNGFIVIRVSHDQFNYSKVDYGFSKDLISEIKMTINNKIPGIYKFGKLYD